MAIAKFHTLEDLKQTGLPMFMSTVHPSVEIGEVYLQDEVISMWDFTDRKGQYIYYDNINMWGKDNLIQYVVNVCKRLDENSYQRIPLKKDLSNLNVYEQEGRA